MVAQNLLFCQVNLSIFQFLLKEPFLKSICFLLRTHQAYLLVVKILLLKIKTVLRRLFD